MQAFETKAFAVVGGDGRQARLCGLLTEEGHRVRTFALDKCALPPQAERCASVREACAGADCVILPMPLVSGPGRLNAPLAGAEVPLCGVFAGIAAGTLVCGGAADEKSRLLAEKQGLRLVDYAAREEVAVAHAVPTAEGAIQMAMAELPVTISGSRCLVIGCGRIGKALSARLRALGASVAVSARKPQDFAWIRAMGNRPLHTASLNDELAGFDALFNTVPAQVLGREQLRCVRGDALVVDLASRPGGVDFDAAGELGLHVHRALSLPGKTAPLTSARIIRQAVGDIMEEIG